MMTTRKNKLMIAAAVAALMTGSGFALAQDSSPATKAPSAAPAEKMAPAPNAAQKAPSAAEQKAPSAADKGAQKSEDKSLPSKRSSERQARIIVSCTASSASNGEASIR